MKVWTKGAGMKTAKKMSKKLLAVGLLGLVLALGVTLVGCGEKCSNGGKCEKIDKDNRHSFCSSNPGCAVNKAEGDISVESVKCDC